ncbi:MAG: M28 family peptidase, partial [Longimicrobiales bacterium]
TPHYLNDFVLNRCLDQAAGSGWVVRTNPYEGGSDHVPFLQAGTAGVLFWHFTDQFYHTDGDRLEMVSPTTLWNVGVCAAVSAMTLTAVDAEIAGYLIAEVEQSGLARLETEGELSRAAVSGGGDPEKEREILESWTDWYLGALEAMVELEPGGASPETLEALRGARARLAEAGREVVASLGGSR